MLFLDLSLDFDRCLLPFDVDRLLLGTSISGDSDHRHDRCGGFIALQMRTLIMFDWYKSKSHYLTLNLFIY